LQTWPPHALPGQSVSLKQGAGSTPGSGVVVAPPTGVLALPATVLVLPATVLVLPPFPGLPARLPEPLRLVLLEPAEVEPPPPFSSPCR